MLTDVAKHFEPFAESLKSFEGHVAYAYLDIDVSKLQEEERARLPRLAESEGWRLPCAMEVSRRLGRVHTLY